MPLPHTEKCANCPALDDENCLANQGVKLSSYRPGQKGTIFQICGDPDFRRRMMEMGFVRGTEVMVVKYAPLSDPIEFIVKGYHLTLRRDQASDILMSEPGQAA
ncbi:MAG: ferrous iron transport protein A [Desulfomonile tiedjei]|nr:ferrous iron transport protein A [Desulfomonile tiedjei]